MGSRLLFSGQQMFVSTKTYGHECGLSTAFRQWRAKSHCNKIHGYALAVRIEFEAETLDENNWVVDFGSLKPIKQWLEAHFDHKLLVAEDDPFRATYQVLHELGMADVIIVQEVGCEAFAKLIFERVRDWLHECGLTARVRMRSVEVSEHGANSAICTGDPFVTVLQASLPSRANL